MAYTYTQLTGIKNRILKDLEAQKNAIEPAKVRFATIESTLLQTYRQLRGSLEGWRSRLQTVVASGDNLDLLDFIQELRNHGKRIKEGRFNRVVAIDPALASVVESSRGYPQGFIGVSVIVLSETVDDLAELNAASTVEDLQAIFSAIETEISEEPQL